MSRIRSSLSTTMLELKFYEYKHQYNIATLPTINYLILTYFKCEIDFNIDTSTLIIPNNDEYIEGIAILPQLVSICKQNPISDLLIRMDSLVYIAQIKSEIVGIDHYIFIDLSNDVLSNGRNHSKCTVCDQQNVCVDCVYPGIIPNFTSAVFKQKTTNDNANSFELQLNSLPNYIHFYRNKKYYNLSLYSECATGFWYWETATASLQSSVSTECGVALKLKNELTFGDDDAFWMKQDLEIEPNSKTIHVKFSVSDVIVQNYWIDEYGVYIIPASVVLAVLVLCILLFVVVIGMKNKRLKEKTAIQRENTHIINNPLVIVIGIAVYDLEPENPSFDWYCPNLPGIDRDYQNVKTLCDLLKYDLYPKQEKYEWSQKDIIEFLQCKAQDIGNENKNGYDSLIVIISGHGIDNNIITTDYQLIDKTAIHRLFSTNYPSLRLLPRIFIFDSCMGDQERSNDIVEQTDKSKNFVVDNIIMKQYNGKLWNKNQKNPDFKLALINACNEGFMAKMNTIDGSYLIYQFVKRLIENIDKKQELFLGEIIDGIQMFLHDLGKQQTQSILNNHTRYLKFRANENRNNRSSEKLELETKNEDIHNEAQDGNVEMIIIEQVPNATKSVKKMMSDSVNESGDGNVDFFL